MYGIIYILFSDSRGFSKHGGEEWTFEDEGVNIWLMYRQFIFASHITALSSGLKRIVPETQDHYNQYDM